MKNTSLKNLSLAELQKREKTYKGVLGGILGVLFVLIAAVVFLIVKKGFTAISIALMITPISLIAIMVANKKGLDEVKAEIAAREISS